MSYASQGPDGSIYWDEDLVLGVAIQSSTVTLNVNISSTSANLNVNLNASSITLNISIVAQTIGIQDDPQFGSGAGTFKNIRMAGAVTGGGGNVNLGNYTVTAGKTFFIYGLSVAIESTSTTIANHGITGILQDGTTGTIIREISGDGGSVDEFQVPYPVPSGHNLVFFAQTWGNNVAITAVLVAMGVER